MIYIKLSQDVDNDTLLQFIKKHFEQTVDFFVARNGDNVTVGFDLYPNSFSFAIIDFYYLLPTGSQIYAYSETHDDDDGWVYLYSNDGNSNEMLLKNAKNKFRETFSSIRKEYVFLRKNGFSREYCKQFLKPFSEKSEDIILDHRIPDSYYESFAD